MKDVLVIGLDPSELPPGVEGFRFDELLEDEGDILSEEVLRGARLSDRRLVIVCLTDNSGQTDSMELQNALHDLLYSRTAQACVLLIGNWFHSGWDLFEVDGHSSTGGKKIHVENEDWTFYFQHVPQWSIGFRGLRQPDARRSDRSARGYANEPIARSATDYVVGAEIVMRDEDMGDGGSCIVLPPPRDMGVAVREILSTRYGLSGQTPEPSWCSDLELPREAERRQLIQDTRDKIAQLEAQVLAEETDLAEYVAFKRLLFTQGAELESIVKRALETLGARNLEQEPRHNQEDFIFEDPQGRLYIAEVKGYAKKRIRILDIRQLEQYRHHYENFENEKRKPILICNHEFRNPPGERSLEASSPENEQDAIDRDQCLMTGVQLYEAVVKLDQGVLDINAFWDSLFVQVGFFAP